LVAFFEVISFFGVVAFFAWLEFLSILNDVASQIEHPRFPPLSPYFEAANRRRAKQYLVRISDHFLTSFVCFAIAVGADYFYHNAFWLGPYFIGSLFHNLAIYAMYVMFFPLGIILFFVGTYYIRQILRGDRSLLARPLNVSGVFFSLFYLGIGIFFAYILYLLTAAFHPYNDFLFLFAEGMNVFGICLTLGRSRPMVQRFLERFGRIDVVPILVLAPIWLLLALVIIAVTAVHLHH
jgi:hypothetical protein